MTDHLTDDQLNEILDASPIIPTPRHLDDCPECRARLDDLRAVFLALESLPEAKLPRDLTASVLSQLEPMWGEMAFRHSPKLNWLFAAQTIAALAIAAWLSSSFELPASFLTYQPPTLDSLLASFFELTSSFSFKLPTFNVQPSMFNFQLSTLNFELSTFNLTLLIVSAAALWVVGNAFLLRGATSRRRPEFIEGARK